MKASYLTVAHLLKTTQAFRGSFLNTFDIVDIDGKPYHRIHEYLVCDNLYQDYIHNIRNNNSLYQDIELLNKLEDILAIKDFNGSIIAISWFYDSNPENTPLNNLFIANADCDYDSYKARIYITTIDIEEEV